MHLTSFLLGVYLTGFFITLPVVAFFCILGGKDSDIWKIFVYPIFWPIIFLFCVFKAKNNVFSMLAIRVAKRVNPKIWQ